MLANCNILASTSVREIIAYFPPMSWIFYYRLIKTLEFFKYINDIEIIWA